MENETITAIGELRKSIDDMRNGYVGKSELDAKLEKITSDIVAKIHPVQTTRTVPPQNPEEVMERAEGFKGSALNKPSEKWTSEYGKKFGDMRGFLKAIQMRSPALDEKAYTGMSEGTPANGGYLVPTEFSSEVFRLMKDMSIIMRIANVMPMSTWKRTFPKQLTSPAIFWVDEAGSKSQTTTTFGQVSQQAKVMAAVIKCTDELLRDSAINLQSFLAEIVAEAMALEIERVALVGNSGGSDPFSGIRYASGVNVVPMAGASVDFDDVIDLIFSLNQGYAEGARIITSRTGLKKLMKLRDNDGNYIWQPPAGNVPATIWNVPYELSGQIPTNLGTGTDETLALFGNFSRYLLVSPREGITVKPSQDAYDAGDSTNAFLQDQTWLRFTQALSIDVAVGSAFSYLQFK